MEKHGVYTFQDISIHIAGQVVRLGDFIDKYTFLKPTCIHNSYDIKISISNPEQYTIMTGSIPSSSRLEIETELEINSYCIDFKCFTADRGRMWFIYKDYGCVYIDFCTNEINSVIGMNCEFNFDAFIILFINPLISLMPNFGYKKVHASCISIGEKNVLITGHSGRGKSTAAFALMVKGHRVLTDESPIIFKKPGGFGACTLIDVIKIRRNAVDRFFPEFNDIFFSSGDDCYILLSRLSRKKFNHIDKIHSIFILEQTGKKETTITHISYLEVIPELFPCSVNPFLPGQAKNSFEIIMDMLSEIDCYKVNFGTEMDLFAKEMERVAEQ